MTKESGLTKTLAACLNLESPKSLFLFAGAGSGKTRAVVEALEAFRERYGQQFRRSGQRVGVITYTNAACDEIVRRIDFDPIFAVSTIHSFAWEQIRTYHKDISAWLRAALAREIQELQEKQASGRAGSKAAAEREVQIELKRARLKHLETSRRFTYNPNGENTGKNSMNHAEVISISATFLVNKPLMQQLLMRKYPVLLIDESQDTQKDLLDAFFAVQKQHPETFVLCLFGDTMQRIYADGKVGLERTIPDDWEKPSITINHRCPKRIVRLINKIRADVDEHQQEPREDAPEGTVRLFLVDDREGIDKWIVERNIAERMAQISSDQGWADLKDVKTLTLEHHMAARRGGFSKFFEPLYQISRFKTGLLDGSLGGISFLAKQVLPLVEALQGENRFQVARIVRGFSPMIAVERLKASNSSMQDIQMADRAVRSLFVLWDGDSDPALIDVVRVISDRGLLTVPEVFAPILNRGDFQEDQHEEEEGEKLVDANPEIDAWEQSLSAPFSQFRSYVEYISDRSPFGTHQGIKGLEFPRVMVVLDDEEARGFMFSYEKLLGAKAPTATDMKNVSEGNETSMERTRRLFYVTCSRAQESLAIVVYTKATGKIAEHLKRLEWFEDGEIVEFDDDEFVG